MEKNNSNANNRKKNKKVKTFKAKVKNVRKSEIIDKKTGAIEEAVVADIEVSDVQFDKLFIQSFLASIDELTTKKIKIVLYLIDIRNKMDNSVYFTYKSLKRDLGVSNDTISKTLQILIDNKFIVIDEKTGKKYINPEIVFRGSSNRRRNLLLKFKENKNAKKTDEETN